jgi:hypothetical protein
VLIRLYRLRRADHEMHASGEPNPKVPADSVSRLVYVIDEKQLTKDIRGNVWPSRGVMYNLPE